ncbi:Agamous-like MADS-box protein AGL80 [Rhynchospora pubera]|uniref:Agamous-like MADS-box protein AGL80 n=1 Tax=Rhynchospora pubera TaxID=906938 RepID=A0AAV8HHN5_9POAL|nr:Agamous-like MADS-box protein AGL80 [Rhynchospora pubera]
MGRKKATMALIPNLTTRQSTFRNRKASLLKKARELSLLCGQPVYLGVSDGPDGSSPEFWPPTEAAAAAQALFHSATSQDKDVEKLEQELTTMQAQLKYLDTENLNLEAEQRLMTALPVGPYRLVEVDSSDLAARIQDILGRRMKEIQDRMDTVHKPPSVAPDVEQFSTKSADHAGLVQPTMTTSVSEDGSYMAPILHLEETMQIDYGDIAISFDPFSGDFMQQHNMQEDTHTPGSINMAASSSAWCALSSGASADQLAPVPGIPVHEDSMDELITAILYPSHDDSMDEDIAAILNPSKDPHDF